MFYPFPAYVTSVHSFKHIRLSLDDSTADSVASALVGLTSRLDYVNSISCTAGL